VRDSYAGARKRSTATDGQVYTSRSCCSWRLAGPAAGLLFQRTDVWPGAGAPLMSAGVQELAGARRTRILDTLKAKHCGWRDCLRSR